MTMWFDEKEYETPVLYIGFLLYIFSRSLHICRINQIFILMEG